MKSAYDFVRVTLSELGCLTDQQQRTKSAVLRHYPDPLTLSSLQPLASKQEMQLKF
jgi:hypothetical protein